VLFILVDDLGWKDLGCYGSSFHETPNIDRLAASSLRFTQAYSANPVCSPTRAAIMTGKHPSRLNITDWIPGQDPRDRPLLGPQDLDHLPLEETTLAEALKAHGYQTFFAGKWHLGDTGYLPEDQGFDLNLGGHHRGSPPGGYYVPYQNPKLPDGPEGEYLTDRLTQEAIQYMQTHKDGPFFVFLSYYTVHTPIQPNREYIEHYRQKRLQLADTLPQQVPEGEGLTVTRQVNAEYASMVHAMDVNVGRLMNSLQRLGIQEHTLVIFTSDNGGLSTLEKNRPPAPTSVRPLRGGKGWCYEGGIRVPLIISMPGAEPGIREEAVASYDFYPTVLEWAGLPLMPAQHQDGLSLMPLLRGADSLQREALFWHYPHYHGSAWTPGAAIRMGDWKLVEFYDPARTELFHLSQDPGEERNVATEYPEKAAALRQALLKMQAETGSRFPTKNPDWQ